VLDPADILFDRQPAPDLFLYAADQMHVEPRDCIVIEDSPAGIAAAKAAGMTVFAFTGGSHANFAGYREELDRLSPEAAVSVACPLKSNTPGVDVAVSVAVRSTVITPR